MSETEPYVAQGGDNAPYDCTCTKIEIKIEEQEGEYTIPLVVGEDDQHARTGRVQWLMKGDANSKLCVQVMIDESDTARFRWLDGPGGTQPFLQSDTINTNCEDGWRDFEIKGWTKASPTVLGSKMTAKIYRGPCPPSGPDPICQRDIRFTVLKVEIAEFDRVVPRAGNEKSVVVTTTPSPLPAGVSVALSIARTSGNEGAATITDPASATITQTTTIKIQGTQQSWGSGDSPAPNNMEIRATLTGGTTPCDTEDFTVCAHPNAVQNGPAHSPINTPTQAGMQIAITVKSESGTDADLDKVMDSEVVSVSFDHTGSMVGVPPFSSSNSGFMPATTVPPDQHASGKAMIIDRCDNHGGAGVWKRNQLDAFYCRRCGMTESDAEAIPSSGYQIIREIIPGGGTKIDFKVEKKAQGCTVGAYTTGAGPSPTYSDTVTVRP